MNIITLITVGDFTTCSGLARSGHVDFNPAFQTKITPVPHRGGEERLTAASLICCAEQAHTGSVSVVCLLWCCLREVSGLTTIFPWNESSLCSQLNAMTQRYEATRLLVLHQQ